MYDLEIIRNTISLAALAEEAGARFDNPHRLISHCPLPKHAGDRSSKAFTIFDNGRKWKCHSSCPTDANGGDLFAFYMAWKGVDFKTAVAELAERARVAPVAQVTVGGSCGKRPLAARNGLAGATASDTKYPLSVPESRQ